MKNTIIVVVVAVIAAIFYFGFNKQGGETKPTSNKLLIWAWDPNFNIAIMKEAKERYLKVNPNAEIEIVDFAKGDLEAKLHTMLASGLTDGLPDIVLIEDYNAQKYLSGYPGSFADLTNKVDYSKFAPYKKTIMTHEGKVYGLPFDTGTSGLYYRSDLLAEAGYSHEDLVDITWDQYIEIGKKVVEKTGKKMLAFDKNDGGPMRIMMHSANSWYTDADGKPQIKGNAALKESIRVYKAIVDSDISKLVTGWGNWVGAFNKGDVASVITGVWITGSVKAEASQSGKWKVAPTPRLSIPGSKNASNLGGSSWYVLKSSKNTELAADFLTKTFGSDQDFYQKILVDRGAVGSYLPSQQGEAYSKEDAFFGGQKVYSEFSKWMKEIPELNYGIFTYEADTAVFSMMPKVYDGSMTIDKALEEAQKILEGQIQ